jgi:hypothetical protein
MLLCNAIVHISADVNWLHQIGAIAGHVFTACGVGGDALAGISRSANGSEQGCVPKLRQCLAVLI